MRNKRKSKIEILCKSNCRARAGVWGREGRQRGFTREFEERHGNRALANWKAFNRRRAREGRQGRRTEKEPVSCT